MGPKIGCQWESHILYSSCDALTHSLSFSLFKAHTACCFIYFQFKLWAAYSLSNQTTFTSLYEICVYLEIVFAHSQERSIPSPTPQFSVFVFIQRDFYDRKQRQGRRKSRTIILTIISKAHAWLSWQRDKRTGQWICYISPNSCSLICFSSWTLPDCSP